MFSPVGSHAPSVYWRRRLIALSSLVLLILLLVLTVRAVTGDDNGAPLAGGPGSSAGVGPSSTPSTVVRSSSSSSVGTPSSKATTQSSANSSRASSSVTLQRCALDSLAVQAVVAQQSYKVGAEPVVELQVTNSATKPCIQDLADEQVELKIYNGESRVWSSHDCEVQRGTADRTLAANTAVRVSIKWSGLTSQPKCAGTRQRVGAGTYTLYATLSGKTGKAAQFSIG